MARQTERRKLNRNSKKEILVLYHGGCNDGFGGAWAAWKKFGDKAEYIAMHRNDSFKMPIGKEIYFIDYLFPEEIIREYIAKNKRVTAIDHHVTMKAAAALTQNPSFSLKNSGSVLAWKYFHPGKSVPLLLRYIEDRDLWKFKLPKSKEILAGTNFSEENTYTFKGFDRLVKDFEKPEFRKKCIEDGKIVKSVFNGINRSIEAFAEEVTLDGQRCYAVNSPHMFASEVGNMLAIKSKKIGIAIVWHFIDGAIRVSLRSRKNYDVSKIAEKFGGGGHKNAAGFIVRDIKDIPWKAVKK